MQWGKTLAIHLGWSTVICSVASHGYAINEYVAQSAEAYGTTGMCAGDALTHANEDGTYVDNGLSTYDDLQYWYDFACDGRDFVDPGLETWGADSTAEYGTDWADVMFFSGHSGGSCTSGAQRAWLTPGDDGEGCSMYLAHVTSGSRMMKFGGTTSGSDADVFITFGCATTYYCVFTAGGYSGLSDTTGQFNMLNGFHGDVAEVSGYQADLGSYSTSVVSNDLGDAWLDWMYDPNANGTEDNCPSSIVYGANTSETDDYYANAGFFDFHDNGSRTLHNFYKICGCDPHNGAALPSC
jgi:hypothetical protein